MPAKTIDSRGAISAASAPYDDYRFYRFRIWYGMVASAWLRLLVRNRFAVSPTRLPFTLFGFGTSVLHSILNIAQSLIFARRIRTCVIEKPPIFIIGHWRTGTTFLHELLMLDECFSRRPRFNSAIKRHRRHEMRERRMRAIPQESRHF